jgi:hypothetical protein
LTVLASTGSAGASAGIAAGVLLLFALYFVVVIGLLVFFIIAVVDMVKRPDWQWKIAGQEKVLWLLLVILLNFLAIPALIYWFNIRKKLIVVEKAAAAGRYGSGHTTYGGWEPNPPPMYTSVTPPSWQPDPNRYFDWRWWDGRQWTEHVSNGETATTPPAEGSVEDPPAP